MKKLILIFLIVLTMFLSYHLAQPEIQEGWWQPGFLYPLNFMCISFTFLGFYSMVKNLLKKEI